MLEYAMDYRAHIRAGVLSAGRNGRLVPLGVLLCVALPVLVFVMIYLPALIKLYLRFEQFGTMAGIVAALKNPGGAMGSMLGAVVVYTIGFWLSVLVALWGISMWQASALWSISHGRLEPAGGVSPRIRDLMRGGRTMIRRMINYTFLFMLVMAVVLLAYAIVAAMVSAVGAAAHGGVDGGVGRLVPIMLWLSAVGVLVLCLVFMFSAGLMGLAFMGLEGRAPGNALVRAIRLLWRREDLLNLMAMLVAGFWAVQAIMWLAGAGLASLPGGGTVAAAIWAGLWLVMDVWLWLVIVGAAVDALASPGLWGGGDASQPPAPGVAMALSNHAPPLAELSGGGAGGSGLDVWQCDGDDYCAEPGGGMDEPGRDGPGGGDKPGGAATGGGTI